MFRKQLKNSKVQSNEISFGCEVGVKYKTSCIIDSANCFKICPDGRLSLKTHIVGFDKVYSLRRLHPDFVEELTRELQARLNFLDKSKHISNTPSAMALFLCGELIASSKKYGLIENVRQTLRFILEELFAEDVVQKLQDGIVGSAKDELCLVAEMIKNPRNQCRRISRLFRSEMDSSLARNKTRVKEFIVNLQQQVRLEQALTAVEKNMLDVVQEKLTPIEMRRLESRKTALIVVPSLKGLSVDHETRAQYLPFRNSIFVKQDSIHHSLIHEIQHSLGMDVTPLHPVRFFKFYYHCKTVGLNRQGVHFGMADNLNVLAYEARAKMEPLNQPLQEMVWRASYLLSLYNYDFYQRDREILAHLRQFIADFGKEETAKILPRLYQYWMENVLNEYPSTLKQSRENVALR